MIGFALLAALLWALLAHAPVPAGTVSVQLDKTSYGRSDTITVTITNQGAFEISVADMQSFCTIVLLEWKGPTAWDPLYNCPQARVPRTIFLEAGGRKTVMLPGPARPIGTALRAGTYRVALIYMLGRVQFGGKVPPGALIVYSPEFVFR